jgi:hypothetical protein
MRAPAACRSRSVRHVIRLRRESNFNPRFVDHGYYGLMQIRLGTARSLGYRDGGRPARSAVDMTTAWLSRRRLARRPWQRSAHACAVFVRLLGSCLLFSEGFTRDTESPDAA